MTTDTTSPAAEAAETALFLGEDWFDPLEAGVRTRIRSFIEELLEAELEAALGRKRYARGKARETEAPAPKRRASPVSGHRHGHRERTLMGTFGAVTICVPRARLATPEGGTTEWRNASIPAYQRLTRRAEALIAGRLSVRHQHAPGAAGAGRAVRGGGRQGRGQPGVAQGEDGLGRLDPARPVGRRRSSASSSTAPSCASGSTARRPRSRFWWCSACAATGRRCCWRSRTWAARARRPGGRCSTTSTARGLRTPEFVIVDGAPGLEKALAALWPDVPAQRCTVHKHRNLLAHAPRPAARGGLGRLHGHDLRRDAEGDGRARARRSCASGG